MTEQEVAMWWLLACSEPDPVEDGDVAIADCAVDVHQHYAGNVDVHSAATALVEQLDDQQIAMALVSTPPVAGDSALGAHYDYTKLLPTMSERIGLVAGGGILQPWMHEAAVSGRAIDAEERAAFRAAATEILDAGAVGFGELAVLHISYAASHPFIAVPADHPLMLELADLAAEREVPIDIHLELVAHDLDVPGDMPSQCFQSAPAGNNPAVLDANLSGFRTLLDSGAPIVWSHVGWDNTGHLDVTVLDELLGTYPNLVASLKQLDEPGPCQVLANRPMDGGTLQADWLDLIKRYPDQFVLGADEFIGNDPSQTAGSASTAGTWSLIDVLPDPERVACTNPRRIFGL